MNPRKTTVAPHAKAVAATLTTPALPTLPTLAADLSIEQLQDMLNAKRTPVVAELQARADALMGELKDVISELRRYGVSVNLMSLSVEISDEDKQAVADALQSAGSPLTLKALAKSVGMAGDDGAPSMKFNLLIKEMEGDGTLERNTSKRPHLLSLAESIVGSN